MFASLLRISLTIFTLYGLLGSNNAFAELAPNFKLDGQHKQIELKTYRGQTVYLDFWASWCQPCRKSFTWMNRMQELYGKEGLTIIAVNLDESRKDANKFLKQVPTSFEVAFDPAGNTAESYNLKAMPSSYVIDKRGKLVYANLGFRADDKDELETVIRTLLRPSAIASR